MIIILSDVKFPHSLNIFSQINPSEKWIICKGTDGQLISSVINYKTGLTTNFGVTQFQRGESMVFNLSPDLLFKNRLHSGDTVGYFNSSYVDEKIAEITGNWNVAKAEFIENKAGEKKPIVEEYIKRIELAKIQLEQEKNICLRTEQLYKKGYSSLENYQIELAKVKQLETEIEINKSILDSRKTGAKPESLSLLEEQIKSYETNLNVLKKRVEKFILVSPIDGEINRTFLQDTILSVINLKEVVIKFPLKLNYSNDIIEGDIVKINLNNVDDIIEGKVLSVSKEVKMLHYEQVLCVSILVDNSNGKLFSGMISEGSIILKPINALQQLKNFFFN
ncbi:MAG: hypothetical protein V1773_03000 [bacterium]